MTDSSMLKYQYDTILDQLLLFQLHAESPDCPCSLKGEKPGELGEYCEPKHLRVIVALARETITMEDDPAKIDYLTNLSLEGSQLRSKMEDKLCGKKVELGDYMTWSRDIRKPLEDMCYSGFCNIPQEDKAAVEEIAAMFKKKEEPRWCGPVLTAEKELGGLYRTLGTARKKITQLRNNLDMPLNICRGQAELFQEMPTGVLDPYGSRCRDSETGQWVGSEECGLEPAGITTTALGMDGITHYEFEFKIVDLDKLIVSHDPFTFAVNPDYPAELQPRIRERAATKIQVEKIAANLEPDAVITDFHVIDRGSPIVGPDMVVEAGNGRVMGIARAAAEYPEKYAAYKQSLAARAQDYGLRAQDIESIDNPLLVRLRISDVDRITFAQEANQAATIAPSAIENARTDAPKITMGMLQELVVGDNESLEDALRAPKNQAFAGRFLATLPENVQAALVDSQGYLNRDGVHRMAMAIFVSAFQGDPGLRLAEKAFESVDMDVRNTISAIARSLGYLAQAESLTRSGERDTSLSIGDDLAQTVNVYSAIKRNPALTVDKYLAQQQIFARELTPFQEGILVVIERYKVSPRKMANIFTAYAEGVIKAPPPAQAALFPGAEITKEGLWESAVKAPEQQPVLMEFIRMFQDVCERPSPRYQHLSGLFTESPAEAALLGAGEEVVGRKIDTALAKLEQGISEIHDSANFKAFADTMSKFHNYSLGNIMLITLQNPGASRVAGFNKWKELGRMVKKGEHGIMILAPCFPPKPKKEKGFDIKVVTPPGYGPEEEEERIEPEPAPVYFKVVHVFDVAQTEGEDLPSVEVPVITGDETSVLYTNVLSYVAKQGFNFNDSPMPELDPGIMGFWSKPRNLIWVRPEVPQDQRTKTALHETAHAKCEMRGAQDAEVMAEGVAYTVANHFGFDTGVRSFPYVAVWAKDIKVLKTNLEIIRKVSLEMIEGIEQVAQFSDLAKIARMFAPIKLLTKEIRGKLPPLYSQEEVADPTVWVKFFTPDAQWTWYCIEFDGEDIFFGWVVGHETELGYFSLKELESVRGPMGLAIERDKWFKPVPLSKVKEIHAGNLAEVKNTGRFCLSAAVWLRLQDAISSGDKQKALEIMWTKGAKLGAPAEMSQGLFSGIGAAVITGVGIGAGFKFVDWVASKFSKRAQLGAGHHGITVPKEIEVFGDKIIKHYLSADDVHAGSIRVTKPSSDLGVFVFLACMKHDAWDGKMCSPYPVVLKTIVPNNEEYRQGLEELLERNPGIKINYQNGQVREDQKELEAVDKALETSEEL